MRLGLEPKGIIGSGWVTSMPYLDRHWNGKDMDAHYVDIKFDILLNPDTDNILSLKDVILKNAKLNSCNWTPQTSGVSLKPDCVDELERIWFNFLDRPQLRDRFLSDSDLPESISEGTRQVIPTTRYERNPEARKRCLATKGYLCNVCGFDFEKTYGERGKGFIHVHHITQISKSNGSHPINPEKDLIPVCPNCHAMLHKGSHMLTIDDLKKSMV